MRKVGKLKSHKEQEEVIWQVFLEKVRKADSGERVVKLLDNLMSAREKQFIAKRLAALAMVKSGKSYKEIGRLLWMSPSTVSALKKSVYKHLTYQSNRYYAEQSERERRKRIKGLPARTIFDYWLDLPFPTKTGKGRWRFLNYQG